MPEVTLVSPDPQRDAPFAYNWFESEHGRETLLLMGNSEKEIGTTTLQQQTEVFENFLILEKQVKQLTWSIRYNNITIGVVWIELVDTFDLSSPAIHIMIGDKKYRRQGIGKMVFNEAIQYIIRNLRERHIYSRHLVTNSDVAGLLKSIGFRDDGDTYYDHNNLQWQNVCFDIVE